MSVETKIKKEYPDSISESSFALRIKEEPADFSQDLPSELCLKNELIKEEIDFKLEEESVDFPVTSAIHSDFQDNSCEMIPEVHFLSDYSKNSPVPFGVKVKEENTKEASVLPKLKKPGLKVKTCENCGKVWYEGTLPIFKNIVKKKKLVKSLLCNVCAHNKTGRWTYFCDVCNKGFHIKSALRTHKLAHSDERPFGCNMCGKKFKTQTYLKRHKNICYKCFW